MDVSGCLMVVWVQLCLLTAWWYAMVKWVSLAALADTAQGAAARLRAAAARPALTGAKALRLSHTASTAASAA